MLEPSPLQFTQASVFSGSESILQGNSGSGTYMRLGMLIGKLLSKGGEIARLCKMLVQEFRRAEVIIQSLG